MESLHLRITIRRPGPAGRPLGFATGPQPYSARLECEGTVKDTELVLNWDGGVAKLLRDLAYPSDARIERAGAWIGGFMSQAGLPVATRAVRAAVEAGRPVHLSVISDAPEILALPWSLLPVGRTRLRSLPGVRIHRGWPGTIPHQDDVLCAREEGRIGLAYSAAGGRVADAAHVEALQQACVQAGRAFRPAADVLPDASLEGIGRWLAQAREHGSPIRALVLVCRTVPTPDGHMGLVLHKSPGTGDSALVDAQTLSKVFAPHADMVRLVVLSTLADDPPPAEAGRTLNLAIALHHAGVPAVIGPRMPLSRQGSARAVGGIASALLSGIDGVEGALAAARQALSAPEDARDQDAVCLLADEEHVRLRPLLHRPWPGPGPLGPEHADTFSGRDEELDDLLDRFETLLGSGNPRFLLLAGGSGTGKTSLVRAGLLPRLLEEGGWQVTHLHPAGDLEARIGAAVGRPTTDGQRHLVVVDPFEAVLDLPAGMRERMIRVLWRKASTPGGRTSILACIRTEALGQCGELVVEDTGTRLDAVAFSDRHQVLLRDPGPRALRVMLSRPAAAGGLSLSGDLAHRIAGAVSAVRPPLPALAAVTTRMWQARAGRTLTSASWQAIGDPQHAVAHLADHVIDGLAPGRRPEALRILRALAREGDAHGPPRARWMTRARLRPPSGRENGRDHDSTIAHLIQGGLIRDVEGPEGPGLTLAHDHIAAAWPRLFTPTQPTQPTQPAQPASPHPATLASTSPSTNRRAGRAMPAWPFVLISILALCTAAAVLLWGHGTREARRDAEQRSRSLEHPRGPDPRRRPAALRGDRPGSIDLASARQRVPAGHPESCRSPWSRWPGRCPVVLSGWNPALTLAGGVPAIWSFRGLDADRPGRGSVGHGHHQCRVPARWRAPRDPGRHGARWDPSQPEPRQLGVRTTRVA